MSKFALEFEFEYIEQIKQSADSIVDYEIAKNNGIPLDYELP